MSVFLSKFMCNMLKQTFIQLRLDLATQNHTPPKMQGFLALAKEQDGLLPAGQQTAML